MKCVCVCVRWGGGVVGGWGEGEYYTCIMLAHFCER